MELNIKEIGSRINNMDMDSRLGLIRQSIEVSTATARSMEKANFYGRTIAVTKGSLNRIISMGLVSIYGQTEGLTKDSGKIIRCKVKECSLG